MLDFLLKALGGSGSSNDLPFIGNAKAAKEKIAAQQAAQTADKFQFEDISANMPKIEAPPLTKFDPIKGRFDVDTEALNKTWAEILDPVSGLVNKVKELSDIIEPETVAEKTQKKAKQKTEPAENVSPLRQLLDILGA